MKKHKYFEIMDFFRFSGFEGNMPSFAVSWMKMRIWYFLAKTWLIWLVLASWSTQTMLSISFEVQMNHEKTQIFRN